MVLVGDIRSGSALSRSTSRESAQARRGKLIREAREKGISVEELEKQRELQFKQSERARFVKEEQRVRGEALKQLNPRFMSQEDIEREAAKINKRFDERVEKIDIELGLKKKELSEREQFQQDTADYFKQSTAPKPFGETQVAAREKELGGVRLATETKRAEELLDTATQTRKTEDVLKFTSKAEEVRQRELRLEGDTSEFNRIIGDATSRGFNLVSSPGSDVSPGDVYRPGPAPGISYREPNWNERVLNPFLQETTLSKNLRNEGLKLVDVDISPTKEKEYTTDWVKKFDKTGGEIPLIGKLASGGFTQWRAADKYVRTLRAYGMDTTDAKRDRDRIKNMVTQSGTVKQIKSGNIGGLLSGLGSFEITKRKKGESRFSFVRKQIGIPLGSMDRFKEGDVLPFIDFKPTYKGQIIITGASLGMVAASGITTGVRRGAYLLGKKSTLAGGLYYGLPAVGGFVVGEKTAEATYKISGSKGLALLSGVVSATAVANIPAVSQSLIQYRVVNPAKGIKGGVVAFKGKPLVSGAYQKSPSGKFLGGFIQTKNRAVLFKTPGTDQALRIGAGGSGIPPITTPALKGGYDSFKNFALGEQLGPKSPVLSLTESKLATNTALSMIQRSPNIAPNVAAGFGLGVTAARTGALIPGRFNAGDLDVSKIKNIPPELQQPVSNIFLKYSDSILFKGSFPTEAQLSPGARDLAKQYNRGVKDFDFFDLSEGEPGNTEVLNAIRGLDKQYGGTRVKTSQNKKGTFKVEYQRPGEPWKDMGDIFPESDVVPYAKVNSAEMFRLGAKTKVVGIDIGRYRGQGIQGQFVRKMSSVLEPQVSGDSIYFDAPGGRRIKDFQDTIIISKSQQESAALSFNPITRYRGFRLGSITNKFLEARGRSPLPYTGMDLSRSLAPLRFNFLSAMGNRGMVFSPAPRTGKRISTYDLTKDYWNIREDIPKTPAADFDKMFRGFRRYDDKTASQRFRLDKLKKLSGGGSDRDVYALGDKYVLKVAKRPRGLIQNEFAGDSYMDKLLPEVFEEGLDYTVQERVTYDLKRSSKFVKPFKEGIEEPFFFGPGLSKPAGLSEKGKKIISKQFEEYGIGGAELNLFDYDILTGDFQSARNWGFRGDKPVLLDEGTLSRSIFDKARLKYAQEDWNRNIKPLRLTPRKYKKYDNLFMGGVDLKKFKITPKARPPSKGMFMLPELKKGKSLSTDEFILADDKAIAKLIEKGKLAGYSKNYNIRKLRKPPGYTKDFYPFFAGQPPAGGYNFNIPYTSRQTQTRQKQNNYILNYPIPKQPKPKQPGYNTGITGYPGGGITPGFFQETFPVITPQPPVKNPSYNIYPPKRIYPPKTDIPKYTGFAPARIKDKKKPQQGYDVLVKRKQLKQGKGKYKSRGYVKANSSPLSREAAFYLGVQVVDKYTNRSFKLEESSRPAQNSGDIFPYTIGLKNKVRLKKGSKSIYVEKTKYAIDSWTEKQGIPYESARQKRRGLF